MNADNSAPADGVIVSRQVELRHFRAGDVVQLPLLNVALAAAGALHGQVWKNLLIVDRWEMFEGRPRLVGRRLTESVDVLVQDPRMLFHRSTDCAACDRDRMALVMQDMRERDDRIAGGETLAELAEEMRIAAVSAGALSILVHAALYDPETFDAEVP